jgi:RNA polymerase sigma-70 factor, ECF subfamily
MDVVGCATFHHNTLGQEYQLHKVKIGNQPRGFDMIGNATNATNLTSEFVALFATHNWGVYKYIRTLVPDPDAAQEIFQETSVTLWEKYGEFQSGGNFFAWACRVAYFKALQSHQARRRDRMQFDDSLLQAIAEERAGMEDVLQAQQIALPHCIQKLPPGDRELIEQRYGNSKTVPEIAKLTGRSINTLYKVFERIRRALMKCIEKTVTQEL